MTVGKEDLTQSYRLRPAGVRLQILISACEMTSWLICACALVVAEIHFIRLTLRASETPDVKFLGVIIVIVLMPLLPILGWFLWDALQRAKWLTELRDSIVVVERDGLIARRRQNVIWTLPWPNVIRCGQVPSGFGMLCTVAGHRRRLLITKRMLLSAQDFTDLSAAVQQAVAQEKQEATGMHKAGRR